MTTGATAPVLERLDRWPDLVALHAYDPERYPFLLESVAHGPAQARWDVLCAYPGERLVLGADGRLAGPGAGDGRFLSALDAWWSAGREPGPRPEEVPFAGGWFIYCGYELAGEIEPCLRLPNAPGDQLPVAAAVRIPVVILRDHERHEAWLASDSAGLGSLAAVRDDLRASAALPSLPQCPSQAVTDIDEDDPGAYLAAVERAKRYIIDGDVFQANLSRAWRGRLHPGVSAFDLYRLLRAHNPAPFAGFMRWGEGIAVASSSPERLVRVTGPRLDARPIAGTRRRGADTHADGVLREELLAHPKERAEHVMLIDLVRNDLGRVATYGSVAVDEFMTIESYATVHHIVSNVTARRRPDMTPGQVIAATFPGGTITGCPKVRCMEIIAELEQVPRGAYTGSFGWLGHDGDLDLNILIRTLTVRADRFELRAGAGIVADSVAEAELDESRAKASGLLRAIGASDA